MSLEWKFRKELRLIGAEYDAAVSFNSNSDEIGGCYSLRRKEVYLFGNIYENVGLAMVVFFHEIGHLIDGRAPVKTKAIKERSPELFKELLNIEMTAWRLGCIEASKYGVDCKPHFRQCARFFLTYIRRSQERYNLSRRDAYRYIREQLLLLTHVQN